MLSEDPFVYRIREVELTVQTGLSSYLCPLDNGVDGYRVRYCTEIQTAVTCPTGLVKIDVETGEVSISTTELGLIDTQY